MYASPTNLCQAGSWFTRSHGGSVTSNWRVDLRSSRGIANALTDSLYNRHSASGFAALTAEGILHQKSHSWYPERHACGFGWLCSLNPAHFVPLELFSIGAKYC